MGLFTGILLLPLAPVRGTVWIAERLAEQAARELDEETAVRKLLTEVELSFERGELTPEEFEQAEDELLERLERARAFEVEEWHGTTTL
jgi:Gas vesicle protein G